MSIINNINFILCWIKRNHVICIESEIVKVNLGSALNVAKGWINFDASLNAFFANWPTTFLKLFYRYFYEFFQKLIIILLFYFGEMWLYSLPILNIIHIFY